MLRAGPQAGYELLPNLRGLPHLGGSMKICCLLPSATEIAYAVGLGNEVAGVTYGCDYPLDARRTPVVVYSKLPWKLTAAEIDRQVGEFVARGESLYRIDTEALQQIKPDLILPT